MFLSSRQNRFTRRTLCPVHRRLSYHHGKTAHLHPNGVCPYSSATKNDEASATNSNQTGILDVVFSTLFFIGGFIFLIYIFRDCPVILELLFIPVLLPIAFVLTIIRKIKEKIEEIFPSQQSSLFNKPKKKASRKTQWIRSKSSPRKTEKKQKPSSSQTTLRSFERFYVVALIIISTVLISPILIIVFISLFTGNLHYKP